MSKVRAQAIIDTLAMLKAAIAKGDHATANALLMKLSVLFRWKA